MPAPFPPRFTRTVDLYGPAAFARVRDGGVVVVGLGGVGSHAAVALARSGVGRLHLIDHDRVSTSSLNRHPCAGPPEVGQPKTEVLARFLAATCPDTSVTWRTGRLTPQDVGAVLGAAIRSDHAVVVDAIDSVRDKVALLAHALGHQWAVICSLGAAGKRDAGAVRTGSLADSRVCPLARIVRRELRAAGADAHQVAAVWSEEPPLGPVGAPPGGSLPDEPGVTRRQPSNMMLPGMFGYALAALALTALGEGA